MANLSVLSDEELFRLGREALPNDPGLAAVWAEMRRRRFDERRTPPLTPAQVRAERAARAQSPTGPSGPLPRLAILVMAGLAMLLVGLFLVRCYEGIMGA